MVLDILYKYYICFLCNLHIAFSGFRTIMRAITRKEDVFVKRTFKQIVHDLIEDGIYAYAMNLAVQRGDYEMLRAFEENIH